MKLKGISEAGFRRLQEVQKSAQFTSPISIGRFSNWEIPEEEVEEFLNFLENNPDLEDWQIKEWAVERGYDVALLLEYAEQLNAQRNDPYPGGGGLEDYTFENYPRSNVRVNVVGVYRVYTDSGAEAKGYTYRLSDGGVVIQDIGSFFEAKPLIFAPNGGGISEESPLGTIYLQAMETAPSTDTAYELTPEEQELYNQMAETSYPVGTSAEKPATRFDKFRSFF